MAASIMDIANGRRHKGRPRNPQLDQAILHTALQLLVSGSFFRMSVDEIAEEAFTNKATVYRRFRSKEDLAFAALASLITYPQERVVTGDLRTDLIWQLRQLQTRSIHFGGMLLTGVALTVAQERPDWLERLRSGVIRARHESIKDVIFGAIERGEVRAGVDVEGCVNLLVGSWHATYINNYPEIPDDWPERAVDILLAYLRQNDEPRS